MVRDLLKLALKLTGFTLLLGALHYYIFFNFFPEIELYLPLWSIYVFNAVLVLIVYGIIKRKAEKGDKKSYTTFSALTMGKMALALVFLIPLFIGRSEHSRIEVINFFIPYFIFLIFEISLLSKFLKNT